MCMRCYLKRPIYTHFKTASQKSPDLIGNKCCRVYTNHSFYEKKNCVSYLLLFNNILMFP